MSPDIPLDLVSFDAVEVVDETDAALLCIVRGEEHWIAKTLAIGSEVRTTGDCGALVIPTWLAREYRLV